MESTVRFVEYIGGESETLFIPLADGTQNIVRGEVYTVSPRELKRLLSAPEKYREVVKEATKATKVSATAKTEDNK